MTTTHTSMLVFRFGTMTIGGRGRFAKMGNLDVDDTRRILDLLRDAGVTTIDTADVYSFGGAEEILGQALEGRRDEFVLVTKAFQPMHPGPHGTGLSRKYLNGRACSLLTFGVTGGFEAGKHCYDAFRLITRLVNLGDAKSLACHPASTTHRQMSRDEQRKAGVTPEMIRLSVGIEHVDDILADLDQALEAADGVCVGAA